MVTFPRASSALSSFIVAAGLVVAAMTSPIRVSADAAYTPPATDAKAVELFAFKTDKTTNYEEKGSSFKVGRAEIFVNAPVSQVKAAILDYGAYSTFIPKFQKSKVLKRDGDATEVYLQIPILHGAATIWAVERFDKPVAEGKGEKVSGVFQKGNVDDFRATWHYRAVDDKHSIVSIDLFIAPKLAVPEKAVTHEVQDACGDGVRAIKEHAEAAAKTMAQAKP